MRGSRLGVLGALLAFWGLVLLGGALEPGYSHVRDHVSRLASFGALYPAVGIGAIAALAVAHGAAALLARRAGARVAAVALALACAAGLAVAAFRISCPGGAAGCRGAAPGTGARTDTAWTDAAHGLAVGAYEVALLAAMVALVWWALRHRQRVLAAVSAAAAVASAVTVLRIGGPDAGADQRLWLAVGTGWLLAVALDGDGHASPR